MESWMIAILMFSILVFSIGIFIVQFPFQFDENIMSLLPIIPIAIVGGVIFAVFKDY
jgi:hypothetical protein